MSKGTVYYYKTCSDTWHFSDGASLPAQAGAMKKAKLQKAGVRVEKLYLDLPEHFKKICAVFPLISPEMGWLEVYKEQQPKQ